MEPVMVAKKALSALLVLSYHSKENKITSFIAIYTLPHSVI